MKTRMYFIIIISLLVIFSTSCQKSRELQVFKISLWEKDQYSRTATYGPNNPWEYKFSVLSTENLDTTTVLNSVRHQGRYMDLVGRDIIDTTKTRFLSKEIVSISQFVVPPYTDTTWKYSVETQKWWRECAVNTSFVTYTIRECGNTDDKVAWLKEQIKDKESICDSMAVDYMGRQEGWRYMPM
ncbi:MAG: hypothetical protein WC564_03365 [Patescibacteria group bacterium]